MARTTKHLSNTEIGQDNDLPVTSLANKLIENAANETKQSRKRARYLAIKTP